jgi:hypothetical protein
VSEAGNTNDGWSGVKKRSIGEEAALAIEVTAAGGEATGAGWRGERHLGLGDQCHGKLGRGPARGTQG